MNKERRAKIAKILAQLSDLKDELESVAGEERDAFDNMPEGLQQSDRGQNSEQAADALDEAVNAMGEAVDQLEGLE